MLLAGPGSAMAKTLAQKAADRQLDEALARVIEAYGLLPAEPNAVDYLRAMQDISSGIMVGALDRLEV